MMTEDARGERPGRRQCQPRASALMVNPDRLSGPLDGEQAAAAMRRFPSLRHA